MKKLIWTLLVLCLVSAVSVTALAADIDQDSDSKTVETTLTTSVAPAYSVTIPADTNILFNATSTDFGRIELTSAKLHPGYGVRISAKTTVLANEADETKTIPFQLNANGKEFTSAEYTAAGEGTALTIDISREDWNKAYAGQYQGTVTFTVEYIQRSGG